MEIVWESKYFNLKGYLAKTVKTTDGKRKTVLKHREVFEEKIGRPLKPNEIVHHIDENKRNNKLPNLEIMTRSRHTKKHARKEEVIKLECLLCKKKFERAARHERHNRKQGKVGPFCNRSCAGKWSTIISRRDGTGLRA